MLFTLLPLDYIDVVFKYEAVQSVLSDDVLSSGVDVVLCCLQVLELHVYFFSLCCDM